MIVILRLTNGHDVAGEIVHEDQRGMTLRYPLLVNYRYTVGGYPSVSFAKYIVFAASDDIGFDRHNILHVVEARDSFKKFYQHALDKYYFELSEQVDKELMSFIPDDTIGGKEEADMYEDVLASIPTERMTMN